MIKFNIVMIIKLFKKSFQKLPSFKPSRKRESLNLKTMAEFINNKYYKVITTFVLKLYKNLIPHSRIVMSIRNKCTRNEHKT